MKSERCLSLAAAGFLAFTLVSCAPPKQVTRAPETVPEPTDTVDTGDLDISDKEFSTVGDLHPIYFEYNRDVLTQEARDTLKANAEFLSTNATLDVLVEGHCDERGTTEYNLALGQHRAASVRKYYISLGLKSSRLGTLSYGEERPADSGHDESAWSKNRRAETKVRRSQQASNITNP